MSDAQNMPVFIREIADLEGRFVGRIPIADLEPMMDLMRKYTVYTNEDPSAEIMAQFVSYEDSHRQPYVGFEVIVDVAHR